MANDPKKPTPGLPSWDDADESALNSLLEGILPEQKPALPNEDDSTSIGSFFNELEKPQPTPPPPLARREEDSTAMFAAPSVHPRALPQEEDDSTAISQVPSFLPPSLMGGLPLPSALNKPTIKLPLPSSLVGKTEPPARPTPDTAATPPYGSQAKIPLPTNIMGESRPKIDPDAEPTPTMRYEPASKKPEASVLPSPQRPAMPKVEEATVTAPLPVALNKPAPKIEIADELFSKPQSKPATASFPVVPAQKPALPAASKPIAPLPPRPAAPVLPKPGEAPAPTGGASAVLARLRATRETKPGAPADEKPAPLGLRPSAPAAKPAAEVKQITPEPLKQSAPEVEPPAAVEPAHAAPSAPVENPLEPEKPTEPVVAAPPVFAPTIEPPEPPRPITPAAVEPVHVAPIEPEPAPVVAPPIEAEPAQAPVVPEPKPTVANPFEQSSSITSAPAEAPRPPINRPSASSSGTFKPPAELPKPPPPSGVFRVKPNTEVSGEHVIEAPRVAAKPPPLPPPLPPKIPTRTAIPIPVVHETSGGGLQEDILDILRDEVPESARAKAWQPQPTSIKKIPTAQNFDVLPPDSDVTEPPTTPIQAPLSLSYHDAAKQDLEIIEAEFLREHEPKRRSALAFEAGRIQDEILNDTPAARVWFEKSLRANPQNKTAAHSLRMAAERTGELKIAIEAIQRELALSTTPGEQSNLQLDAAELWRRIGNEPELKAALKRAAELAPDDSRAQYANVLQNRLLKQWDAYALSAQKFAGRGDIGGLAPALFWDVGAIEEFIRRDDKKADAAYRSAENVGELAAQSARERLALKREDFVEATRLAPREALAASCLRVGHKRDEISDALQRLAQLPPSVASVMAQDPKRIELMAEHLSTASAKSAALAVYSFAKRRPELLAQVSASTEITPLALSIAANSTPFEAASFLLPLFPELRGVIAEHYTKDTSEALSAYISRWRGSGEFSAAQRATRLMDALKRHEELANLPEVGFPAEEQALRLLERFDARAKRGDASLDLLLSFAEQHLGLAAFVTAQRPLMEKAGAYLEIAQRMNQPMLRAALFLHVARLLETQGDNHRALDALLRSLELQPSHRPTREAALRLAGRGQDNALYRSLRASELSLSQDPKRSASISYELGALREEEGDDEAAATHYMNALSASENHVPALLALARLASLRKDFASQAKYLTALLPLQEANTKASTLLMLGELFAWPLFEQDKAQQRWKEAWGTAAIAARPSARALEVLCSKQNDLQTLGMIYQSALTSEAPERRTEFLVRLASLASELGSHEIAGRFYYDTLQQNPSHPIALLGLSAILLSAGRVEDVQRIYQQAAGTSQTREQKAAFELNALSLMTNPEERAQALGRLFAVAPAMPLTQQSMISLARQNQDWATEASVYQQLSNMTEDTTERAFWKIRQGQAQLRLQSADALMSFTEALAMQPGALAALRGQESAAKQAQDERLECSTLEQLGELLIDPREAGKALLKAADIATRLEPDGERARQSLWKALKRDPKNLEAFTKLRATLSPTSLKDALTIKQVIEQRLEAATGEERRLLLGELASLCKERLNEPQGARLALRELVAPANTPYQQLVDLAELEEQAKEYSAAADLYLRILRLTNTTPKQRRDAYWHSGIIYDDHLPDVKRATASFQHVLSLGGLGEKEATLRLSRLLIKTNERSQAADLILRVATAESEPKARLAFLLQSTKLWLEFDDKAHAIACCQRALTIDEHHIETIELLADLYQKKGDDKARATHLSRAVLSFCQDVRKNITSLESYYALVRIFRLMNDQTRATAAAVLYCAFGGEQADIRALAQTAENWPAVSPEKLLDPKAKEKLQHPNALPGFRTLLSWLGDIPKRAFPSEIWNHGAGAQDRQSSGPAVTLFQTIGKALGVASSAVYVAKLAPFSLVTEPSSPTAFILGSELLALPPGAELRFVVARAAYLAGQGPIYAHSLKPADLRDILIGAALALQVPTKLQKTPKAEEISKLAASALSRRDSVTASSLVLESLRGGEFPQVEFAQGVKHEANRCAVLLTGSLRASLEALARIHGVKLPKPGEKVGPVIAQSAEFNELIQFVLSDDYLALRR